MALGKKKRTARTQSWFRRRRGAKTYPPAMKFVIGSMLMVFASNNSGACYSDDSDSGVGSPSSTVQLASSSELGYASLPQFDKNCFSCLSYVEGLDKKRPHVTAKGWKREQASAFRSGISTQACIWIGPAASACIIHKICAHGEHMHMICVHHCAPRQRQALGATSHAQYKRSWTLCACSSSFHVGRVQRYYS